MAAEIVIALVPDQPVAIPLAVAVVMRFGVTAEDLNEPGPLRSSRALFTITLPVLLSAIGLAEHASSGFWRFGFQRGVRVSRRCQLGRPA